MGREKVRLAREKLGRGGRSWDGSGEDRFGLVSV